MSFRNMKNEYTDPEQNDTQGAVAQLGERRVRNAKVVSSILISSTIKQREAG